MKNNTSQDSFKLQEVHLPIRGVVLFKHGVAYVEREGNVKNDSKIELFFKSSEMNDVLKSLTVLDLNGGIISSISYAANRSVSDQIEDIAVRIPERQSLTGLLNQLKGSKVKVLTKDEQEMEGVVLGTENFTEKLENQEIQKPHLNLLVNGCRLVTLDIMGLKSISFLDEYLKKDLEHLLNILISSKKKDNKQLIIHCAGKGDRTVYLSYIVEAPLWKTSYRLILGSSTQNEPKEKQYCDLQAWAMVDNTMDEDWLGVKLSLVSGLPISFIHDLYNPKHIKRPVVQVKDNEQSYGAPVLESGSSNLYSLPGLASTAKMATFGGGGSIRSKLLSHADAKETSTPVSVRNVQIGDLFHYEIKHAVTVKRNGAALVPIYNGKIECDRLCVYNSAIREKNPMSTLLVRNTTNVSLEGGPVTVFEDENYVGEAMLDTLKPNQEKMIPYSVELGCNIHTDHKSSNDKVHEIKISGGYMYENYWSINTTIYNIDNKNEKKKLNLVLEHKFLPNYVLFETDKYSEKTDNYYRFKMEVDPKSSKKFIVKEKKLNYSQFSLRSINESKIKLWISSSFIDKNIEDQLSGLAKILSEKEQYMSQSREAKEKINQITQNQNRIRDNLNVLNDEDSKTLRTRYITMLEKDEDVLKALNQQLESCSNKLNKLDIEFNEKLNAIAFKKLVK